MAGKKETIDISEIRMLMHEHAESGFVHTTYDDESRRFHLLMNGDMKAVEESDKLLNASIQGTLSADPLRNMRYLFIINTGLATRYMVEAGLSQETVFSIIRYSALSRCLTVFRKWGRDRSRLSGLIMM